MFFSILFGLLAETPAIYATPGSSGRGLLAPEGLGRALNVHGRRDDLGKHNLKLISRQSSPPITNVPDCTLYDGYFYVTPQNYTWQLQCSNSYDGTIVAQTTDTTDLSSCITECFNYNLANTPGACVAVTFSGSYSTSDTVCTQYSSIDAVYLASEEGGAVNSALLILGPDGEIFATPQPEPTFSGAPTRPPNVDPVPSQTTTSAEIITTSALLITTSSLAVVTSYAALTTTVTSTSTILFTSCLAGQSCQPNNTPASSTSASGSASGIDSQTTSGSSISISDGGSRPITPTSGIGSQTTSAPSVSLSEGGSGPITTTSGTGLASSSTISGAVTLDAELQSTFTTIVPFTEYRVQIIEICAATPAPCSQSASTATSVANRTKISCSPGACIGVVPTTGFLVDAIAAATCVVVA